MTNLVATTHYLATKPSGLVTVWLVVALVAFIVAAIMAYFGPVAADGSHRGGLLWPAFLCLGLIAFVLAFLT